MEASGLPASLPSDSPPIIAQPVAEQVEETKSDDTLSVWGLSVPFNWIIKSCFYYFQIPVEAVSVAVPVRDISPPPPVSNFSPVSADPTPVLTQPGIEQVADVAPTAVEVLQAATTEASLAELGLAHHTPVGLIQNLLEFFHVDLGLPWWGAIVVGKHRFKGTSLLICER